MNSLAQIEMFTQFPLRLPPRILILHLDATAFIGALENIENDFVPTRSEHRALVVSLQHLQTVSGDCQRALERVVGRLRAHDIPTILIEANEVVKARLIHGKLLDAIGRHSYFADFQSACRWLKNSDVDRRPIVVNLSADRLLVTSLDYLSQRDVG